jgi:heat shock protein 4
MEVEGESKNNAQKQTSILFDKGCPIPNVKSITFHREEAVDFKLFYDPIVEGFDPLIAQFFIHNQKAKEIEYGLKLRVHLNRNSIVEFESAQLLEDYYEEVITPVTEPQTTQPNQTGTTTTQTPAQEQAQKDQDVKKKKKTKSTILKTDITPVSGYPIQLINKFFEEECQMAHQDKIIHETYDKKNELESYIYDMRGKLNDKYAEYALADAKEKILAALSQTESWLYQDGAKAAKNSYVSRIEELRRLGDPVTKRFNEYANIPEAVNNFLNTLKGYEQILLSNDPNVEHITSQERQPILAQIQKQRDYLKNVTNLLGTMRKDQDPTPTSADINAEHEKFVNAAKPVINKPKPIPPKEEPKKTEPQANANQPNAGAGGAGGANTETEPTEGEKMDIEK